LCLNNICNSYAERNNRPSSIVNYPFIRSIAFISAFRSVFILKKLQIYFNGITGVQ
jgi:hypothetical protein